MTRDEAREAWSRTGLTFADLTRENVMSLRNRVDAELRTSRLIRDTYKAEPHIECKPAWFAINCRAYYFRKRQAVTFDANGWVGFAGWADDKNVQPILRAFVEWAEMITPVRVAA